MTATTTTPTTELREQLSTLADLAPRVAAQHEEHQAALAALAAEEAALLDRVVGIVRPALRALSSRPLVGSRTCWHGASTSTSTHRADWRGVRLAGSDGPDEDHPRDNDGAYEGSDLYLRPDGTWTQLAYTGTWSRWQGATCEWEAEAVTLTVAQVVAEYEVADLVRALLAACERQLAGNATARTAAARQRAATLAALVALL